MNIAVIVRKLNVKGGTQRQALSLAQELRRQGHEITLYTFAYDKEKCYSDLLEDLRVVSLQEIPRAADFSLARYVGFSHSFFEENRLAKKLALLIDGNIDLLNPHDQVSERVAYYFKRLVRPVPSVWMINDMPTRRWFYWRERHFRPNLRVSPLRYFFWWLEDMWECFVFTAAQDRIVVLDHANVSYVRRYLKRDAAVVRSGLDADKFAFVPHGPPIGRRAKLLATGILFPHRRLEDVIECLGILRDRGYHIEFSVVGDTASDPAYYAVLSDRVRELRLEPQVRFYGKVSDEELIRLYQESDIFVFPNHIQTWGLAVFEAQACGLPVVVSKTSGASEVLEDHKTALIVPPKSPQAIADAIQTLIDHPALYQQLVSEGNAFVRFSLSWGRYAQGMLAVFLEAQKKYV